MLRLELNGGENLVLCIVHTQKMPANIDVVQLQITNS